MYAANKIDACLILSCWICMTVLLVEGKKYPCVLNEKVPDEEFGPAHYGELGFLRNVILNVAASFHKQMKLETPLRLCKLLSDVRTSTWKFYGLKWKKKSRDKYGTEFNLLEKQAERVLVDLIEDARLSDEFSQEDQDAIAKVIDEAKKRLEDAKIYTNEDSSLLKHLMTLRSTYCPKVAGSIPINTNPSESQQNNLVMNRFAKAPLSVPIRTMPVDSSKIENLELMPPATQNAPLQPSLISPAAILPKIPLPSLNKQPTNESGSDSTSKPNIPRPNTSASSEPSSENGQVGQSTFQLFDWHKPTPQPNEAISNVAAAAPALAAAAPAFVAENGGKCDPSGKGCRPVRMDANGKILGPVDMSSAGMAAPDPSQVAQNNHVHTPVNANSARGINGNERIAEEKAQAPPNPMGDINPTILSKLGISEKDIRQAINGKKEGAATAPAAKTFASQPSTTATQPELSTGTWSSNDPRLQGLKISPPKKKKSGSSMQGPSKPFSAADPIQELQNDNEFKTKLSTADRPVFVQFHSDDCDPCKIMTPILLELIRSKQGKVYLLRIDADEFPDIYNDFKIQALPNIRVFRYGREVKVVSGYEDRAALEALVNEFSF